MLKPATIADVGRLTETEGDNSQLEAYRSQVFATEFEVFRRTEYSPPFGPLTRQQRRP